MDSTLVFGFNLEKDKCIIQDRKLKVHVDGQDKKYPGNTAISLMFEQL